jgi:hypothetical protein
MAGTMSETVARRERREIRRAFGPAAQGVLRDYAEAIGLLQASITDQRRAHEQFQQYVTGRCDVDHQTLVDEIAQVRAAVTAFGQMSFVARVRWMVGW